MPRSKTITQMLLAGVAGTLMTASMAAAQDCTPKHKFPTVEAGTLTVAVTTYAPHSYVDENGVSKGI